jgi:hypothetical protein
MSTKSESVKRQKKSQRKLAKRKIKHASVRKELNRLKSLGVAGRSLSIQRANRTRNIGIAIQNIENIIKKYNDVITIELIQKIDAQKAVLKTALKSKSEVAIQTAVNDFVPLNKELIDIVEAYDRPNGKTDVVDVTGLTGPDEIQAENLGDESPVQPA